MSLIKCPECNKEISNKSKQCIHCGYPLVEEDKNICLINGKTYDLSFVFEFKDKQLLAISELVKLTNCNIPDAKQVVEQILTSGEVPKTLYLKERENKPDTQQTNSIKCPICGCTDIQMVNRKWSLLTGFMTNKVDRVCVKCKYKF